METTTLLVRENSGDKKMVVEVISEGKNKCHNKTNFVRDDL